jgi:hypothetical protein
MLIPLGILAASGAAVGDYQLIETQILGSSQASVVFSSLGTYSSTYKHLQLRYTAQTVGSATTLTAIIFRLNSDTGSNYTMHSLKGQGSSVTSDSQVGLTGIVLNDSLPRTSQTSKFGAGVIDFLEAFSTTKNKTIRTLYGAEVTGEKTIALHSAVWLDTDSITSIELTSDFGTGSRFSLYGIKG